MLTKVLLQISEVVGAVVAVRAVLVFRPTLVVDFCVLFEIAFGEECFAAVLTFERLVSILFMESRVVKFKLFCSCC
jgi:hypothetical protein